VSFMRELHMAFLDYCSERTIRSATNQKLKSDEKRHRSSKSSKRNAVENDANIERSGCPFGRSRRIHRTALSATVATISSLQSRK
jgi:hypothetical protein